MPSTQVVDVADGTSLASVPGHRQRPAGEGLTNEGGMARPSFGRIRAPKVLKIRTIAVPTLW